MNLSSSSRPIERTDHPPAVGSSRWPANRRRSWSTDGQSSSTVVKMRRVRRGRHLRGQVGVEFEVDYGDQRRSGPMQGSADGRRDQHGAELRLAGNGDTIAAAAMNARESAAGGRSVLVRFDSTGAATRRLYCLPFAGGGPSTYRLWPRSLPSDVEVLVIVLPGRDPRTRAASGEPPPGSMAELVEAAHAEILTAQRHNPLPFAIFGHSMGALVAYELTVALECAAGTGAQTTDATSTPAHLFVSGRRPPDERHEGERIHDLADEEFLDKMQRLYGGVPDAVRQEPELLALFLPGLRADVQVFETYAPLTDRRVQCMVRVYGGVDDRRPKPERLPGWQRLVEHEISLRTFPGGHFYLNDARAELVADITAHWSGAEVGSSPGSFVPDAP